MLPANPCQCPLWTHLGMSEFSQLPKPHFPRHQRAGQDSMLPIIGMHLGVWTLKQCHLFSAPHKSALWEQALLPLCLGLPTVPEAGSGANFLPFPPSIFNPLLLFLQQQQCKACVIIHINIWAGRQPNLCSRRRYVPALAQPKPPLYHH